MNVGAVLETVDSIREESRLEGLKRIQAGAETFSVLTDKLEEDSTEEMMRVGALVTAWSYERMATAQREMRGPGSLRNAEAARTYAKAAVFYLKARNLVGERRCRAWQDCLEGGAEEVETRAAHAFLVEHGERPADVSALLPPLSPAPVNRVRRYSLAFPTAIIAPRARCRVRAQPQVAFRADRLIIDARSASDLMVDSLLVGNSVQMVAGGESMPGILFSSEAPPFVLRMDTAQVSQMITLDVTNTSDRELSLQAVLVGVGVD